MSSISSQYYISQPIISKLKLLHILDVILTSTNPVEITGIPFSQILQAYSDGVWEILCTEILKYYESAHECVIYACIQDCRRDQTTFEENWCNVHEDLLNRIRYGGHEHLYKHHSENRFDNLYLHLEKGETPLAEPLPLQHILDSCSAAFLVLTATNPQTNL
jgi:hypothetical protein